LSSKLRGTREIKLFDSELTSEKMIPFRYFGRTLWMGDRPVSRILPTQDSTTQANTSSGIPTHEPSVRAVKTQCALDRTTTTTCWKGRRKGTVWDVA